MIWSDGNSIGGRPGSGLLRPFADLAGDDRFADETSRLERDAELTAVLADVFARRGKDEWERELLEADVGCVAVTTERIEYMFQRDEFGTAGRYVVDVCHPTFDVHPRLSPLVRFSRSATQARSGVLAGSATESVLAEFGYDAEMIADLRARNIVA